MNLREVIERLLEHRWSGPIEHALKPDAPVQEPVDAPPGAPDADDRPTAELFGTPPQPCRTRHHPGDKPSGRSDRGASSDPSASTSCTGKAARSEELPRVWVYRATPCATVSAVRRPRTGGGGGSNHRNRTLTGDGSNGASRRSVRAIIDRARSRVCRGGPGRPTRPSRRRAARRSGRSAARARQAGSEGPYEPRLTVPQTRRCIALGDFPGKLAWPP
jgi:hypothetical protein